MSSKQQIMTKQDIQRTLTRMVHEILELNKDLDNLVIVGIRTRGAYLAERIAKKIGKIGKIDIPLGMLDITLHRDDLDLNNKMPIVNETDIPFDVTDKNIILIDDVLFSGRTIRAALDEIMDFGRPRKIQLAVLIDRGHRELPIKADYIGKNVYTTMTESIGVRIKEVDKKEEVFKI